MKSRMQEYTFVQRQYLTEDDAELTIIQITDGHYIHDFILAGTHEVNLDIGAKVRANAILSPAAIEIGKIIYLCYAVSSKLALQLTEYSIKDGDVVLDMRDPVAKSDFYLRIDFDRCDITYLQVAAVLPGLLDNLIAQDFSLIFDPTDLWLDIGNQAIPVLLCDERSPLA